MLQVDSLTTELSGEPESNYLDPATNLQEYEGQRNMMNHTTSTQLAKSRQVRCSGFFTDILQEEEEENAPGTRGLKEA